MAWSWRMQKSKDVDNSPFEEKCLQIIMVKVYCYSCEVWMTESCSCSWQDRSETVCFFLCSLAMCSIFPREFLFPRSVWPLYFTCIFFGNTLHACGPCFVGWMWDRCSGSQLMWEAGEVGLLLAWVSLVQGILVLSHGYGVTFCWLTQFSHGGSLLVYFYTIDISSLKHSEETTHLCIDVNDTYVKSWEGLETIVVGAVKGRKSSVLLLSLFSSHLSFFFSSQFSVRHVTPGVLGALCVCRLSLCTLFIA